MPALRKIVWPGVIRASCDAGHGWMSAYVHIFDHPYFAVTGPDGRFEIDGLPAGSYTLAAWHEKLGRRTVQVTVPDDGAAQVALEYP